MYIFGVAVRVMDPSTAGDYAFILIPESLARWHGCGPEPAGRRVNPVHSAMIPRSNPFDSFVPAYLWLQAEGVL